MWFYQHEPVHCVRQDPQEVVFYCESRLRAMMNEFEHAGGKKDWIKAGMKDELVSAKFKLRKLKLKALCRAFACIGLVLQRHVVF